MLFCCLLIYSKINFFKKKSFRVSNGLDPDQAEHFVGPDLGPASFIYTVWVKEAGLDLHCFQNRYKTLK